MNKATGLLLLLAAGILTVWWWRKNYVKSPLDEHYEELDDLNSIGALAQYAATVASWPVAMLGNGWGTTVTVNAANPNPANNPAPITTNFTFAQPTNTGSAA